MMIGTGLFSLDEYKQRRDVLMDAAAAAASSETSEP